MYKRAIVSFIERYLQSKDNKILFIWGPRLSGKTTLLGKISKEQNVPIFDFDSISARERFVPREEVLAPIVAEHK